MPHCLEVNVVLFVNCRRDTLPDRNHAGDVVPFELDSGRAEGDRKTKLVHRLNMRQQMINDENRRAGDAFAGAFQGALVAALREHQNLQLYEVHILNPNTVFMLANGEREMVIDAKLRR